MTTKPDSPQKIIKIANCGMGVNSIAGLLKYTTDNYDEIIFSDTGSEKPETYEYLKFLKDIVKWPITVIDGRYQGKVLYDYYIDRKSYPNAAFRDCTKKFKITPMRKYLRLKYGKKAHFLVDLFIDYSEVFRMRDSDVQYQTLNYPLINDKIDREGCLKIIKDAGWPIPEKSACFMCPFSKPEAWLKLKEKHPELFEKAVILENIAGKRRKKEYNLINLKETLKDGNQSCLTGYCYT